MQKWVCKDISPSCSLCSSAQLTPCVTRPRSRPKRSRNHSSLSKSPTSTPAPSSTSPRPGTALYLVRLPIMFYQIHPTNKQLTDVIYSPLHRPKLQLQLHLLHLLDPEQFHLRSTSLFRMQPDRSERGVPMASHSLFEPAELHHRVHPRLERSCVCLYPVFLCSSPPLHSFIPTICSDEREADDQIVISQNRIRTSRCLRARTPLTSPVLRKAGWRRVIYQWRRVRIWRRLMR